MEKKNTILLTVIAIATLLVAVLGATFAFFTAQRGEGAQADIKVTTSTSDSIIYGEFKPLLLKATQQNFNQSDMNSQRASTEGTITLTASDNVDRGDEADYCYTSTIRVTNNTFTYKPTEEDDMETEASQPLPELILSISIDDSGEYKEYTQQIDDFTYKTIENGDKKVCDQENGEVPQEAQCNEETIKGYDITKLGKNSTPGQEPVVPYVDFNIPVLTDAENQTPDKPNIHHIKTSGAASETKEVKWKASIIFVNYDFDQQYNTDKQFAATWIFTPVDCTTGDAINAEPVP